MSELKTNNRARGAAIARGLRQAHADAFAASVLPIIASIRAEGITTNTDIAAALNARGVGTATGGTWSNDQVRLMLKRTA